MMTIKNISFMIVVNNDTQLMNRTIRISVGLFDNNNNMMEMKSKSCGNRKMIYKADALTACYLNYCSKIVDHGKLVFF